MQFINLKLLSKFHVGKRNCSQVISKSLKVCTCLCENSREKTNKHVALALVVPITALMHCYNHLLGHHFLLFPCDEEKISLPIAAMRRNT